MEKQAKFYILTDIHYVSKKCWDCDVAIADKSFDPIQFKESEEILKEACDIIKQDTSTDTVLVLGDNTNIGDFDSLAEVSEIMQDLVDAGKRVFMIVAGHDGHGQNDSVKGIRFASDGSKQRAGETATRVQARQAVQKFGFNQAVEKDITTGSFLVAITEDIYYLAISDDPSIKVGTEITPKQQHMYKWVESVLNKYQAQGKTIFAGIHYPVIFPSKMYSAFTFKLPDGQAKSVVDLLADNGVRLVFTGHTHIHNIACTQSAHGNCLYDVSTTALTAFPPMFRKVSFDGKTAEISTVEIKTLSRFDLQGKLLKTYTSEPFLSYIKDILHTFAHDYDAFLKKIATVGIKAKSFRRLKFIMRPIGRAFGKLSLYNLGRWSSKETGLTEADILPLKEQTLIDFGYKLIVDVFNAKKRYTPCDTEYKVVMGTSAILDDILQAFHINIKKKTGFATFGEIFSDLLYDDRCDKYNATLDVKTFVKPQPVELCYSHKGKYIATIITLIAIVLFPFTIAILVLIAIIKRASKKKDKRRQKRRMKYLRLEWFKEKELSSQIDNIEE